MVGSTNGPMHQGKAGGYDAHNHWIEETPVLNDNQRLLPETVPQDYLGTHKIYCKCAPCVRFLTSCCYGN